MLCHAVGLRGHKAAEELWISADRNTMLRHGSAHSQISKQPGESIYKGHRSYDLMLNLQLGIRFSVGSITSKPVPNQLSNSDFQRTVRHPFTQPHCFSSNTGCLQLLHSGWTLLDPRA